MSKRIYFKFSSQSDVDSIPFENSSGLSVSSLIQAIRTKKSIKSVNIELEVYNESMKKLSENDFVAGFEKVIIKMMPVTKLVNKPNKKTTHVESFVRSDPYKQVRMTDQMKPMALFSTTNKDLSDDENMDIVANFSNIVYQNAKHSRMNPSNPPPPSYICNKCNLPGHWIKFCPGVLDKFGNLIDSRKVKRPSGIPTCTLKEVDENTPNSYLTIDGRYVVNVRNYEAAQIGKKEKKPFSVEENPPVVAVVEEKPKEILCGLCKNIFDNPLDTPCCKKTFCGNCISSHLFDTSVCGSHQCPNCSADISKLHSLTENIIVAQIVTRWRSKKITKSEIEQTLGKTTVQEELPSDHAEDSDDLVGNLSSLSNKENVSNPGDDKKEEELKVEETENELEQIMIYITAEIVRKYPKIDLKSDEFIGLVKSMAERFGNKKVENDNQRNGDYKRENRSRSRDNYRRRRSPSVEGQKFGFNKYANDRVKSSNNTTNSREHEVSKGHGRYNSRKRSEESRRHVRATEATRRSRERKTKGIQSCKTEEKRRPHPKRSRSREHRGRENRSRSKGHRGTEQRRHESRDYRKTEHTENKSSLRKHRSRRDRDDKHSRSNDKIKCYDKSEKLPNRKYAEEKRDAHVYGNKNDRRIKNESTTEF